MEDAPSELDQVADFFHVLKENRRVTTFCIVQGTTKVKLFFPASHLKEDETSRKRTDVK